VISKIKTRMASEEGFTLIELLVVIIILGILVAIAVPAYLSFAGKAKIAAAESNVRSAIPAAESYYEANPTNPTTYVGLTGAVLRQQAPGISPNVKAGASNSGVAGAVGDVYCIQDSEDGTAANTYSYLGGAQPAGTANAATIVQGACPAAYGVA
jgi:type IV pilus assembly protein PilA